MEERSDAGCCSKIAEVIWEIKLYFRHQYRPTGGKKSVTKQVTLAMLYGPKPPALSALITQCREQISAALGDYFHPYDTRQVHATLISLERAYGSLMDNLHFEQYRNQQKQMNIADLLNFIRTGGRFPFQIQIGGFQKRIYPFVSQGQIPYERSFSILRDEVAVPLIVGWPIRGVPARTAEANTLNLIQEARIYPNVLDEIRQSLQTFNVLHRYHTRPTDVDNDFYFRIGVIYQSPPDYQLREKVENIVRNMLSTMEPTNIEINVADIYVVAYQDETLPLSSSQAWSLNDSKVTPEFICNLYE